MLIRRGSVGMLRWVGILVATGLGAVCFAQAEQAGTSSPLRLRKVRDTVVYSDPQFYSAFPSVVARPDGELICAFRRAPSRRAMYDVRGDAHTDANSYLVAVRSRDGGETWTSSPQLIYAHTLGGSQDPCLLQLRNGNLLCASYGWMPISEKERAVRPQAFVEPGFGFLGGYLLRSADGGATWDGPIYPPAVLGNKTTSITGGPLPAYNRGALCEMRDGTILWAVACHDTTSPLRTSVHLLRSRDGGISWDYSAPIAADPKLSFNETSVLELRDGTIAAFLRTEGNGQKAGLGVSRDGGKTFEPWQDLGWAGLPQQAIQLKAGGILLVYGYRQKPFGVRARLVADDLSDVKTAPELVLREDGGSADLGYPWAVQLEDGRVLVVYYMNVANEHRHIAATELQVVK